jgi:hypothetical protein
MTTGEISDLFFNSSFVEDVYYRFPRRPAELNIDRLAEAAEQFLQICSTAAEGGITKAWLMHDFCDREEYDKDRLATYYDFKDARLARELRALAERRWGEWDEDEQEEENVTVSP